MKKMILAAALVACLPCGIFAAAEPAVSFPLELQPDNVVQNIMKNMTDQELGRLAQTSRRFHDLAQPELAMRIKSQRQELVKHLSQDGQTLDHSHMMIGYLMPGVFDDTVFANVTKLYLGGNRLTILAPGVFNGLPKLQILELGSNRLTALAPDLFNGLPKLQLLSLSGNPLTEPTKEALRQYFARRPNFKLYL